MGLLRRFGKVYGGEDEESEEIILPERRYEMGSKSEYEDSEGPVESGKKTKKSDFEEKLDASLKNIEEMRWRVKRSRQIEDDKVRAMDEIQLSGLTSVNFPLLTWSDYNP